MKIILIASFWMVGIAWAQDSEGPNEKDPSLKLYQTAHTAASVVDGVGAYENQVSGAHGIAVDKSCPGCNLHGSLSLVDENGTVSAAKASGQSEGQSSKSQGR